MRWLTRYPLGLIVGAACLVIAPAGRLSADQPLESLTRAWDGRQSRTKTAHFEWTESIVKDRDPLGRGDVLGARWAGGPGDEPQYRRTSIAFIP